MKPQLDRHVLCNANNDKEYRAISKKIKCFGLKYTVCFDLSRTDDVVRVMEGKI